MGVLLDDLPIIPKGNERWLAELQRVMRAGQGDLAGIVAQAEVLAPESAVSSADDLSTVTRTQLSLIRSATNGQGEVQLSEALSDAGVTPEMFRQITERSDFAETFLDLNKRYFFIARLPQMLAALSASAMAGNVKAFDSLTRFFGNQEGKLGGDLAATVLHGSPIAVLRIAERQLTELVALVDTLRAAQDTESRKIAAEAQARAAVLGKIR